MTDRSGGATANEVRTDLRGGATANEVRTVRIYSKNGCTWCTKAKDFLTKQNTAFEEINLSNVTPDEYSIEKNKLIENTGQKTFPYIFIDDKFIGGFNELLQNYVENYVDF
jgi:glutaredoxin